MRPIVRVSAGCAVLVAFGALGCARDEGIRPTTSSAVAETQPAPPRLLDLDGRPFDLWAPGRAAVTVVVFTRTDCPISNRYAPEIRGLYETYHKRGVDFFLVYVDPRESAVDVRRHLTEYGYPCPGLRDPQHALVAYCHATATPEAVVFDKDRTIAYRGRIDDLYADLTRPRAEPTTHDLADAIESTLLGRPVANPRTTAVGCVIADVKD
jgi:hypothetical protein